MTEPLDLDAIEAPVFLTPAGIDAIENRCRLDWPDGGEHSDVQRLIDDVRKLKEAVHAQTRCAQGRDDRIDRLERAIDGGILVLSHTRILALDDGKVQEICRPDCAGCELARLQREIRDWAAKS